MFSILKKLLNSEGGWMAAIPMMMQMGTSIAGMIQGNKAKKGATKKSGEEQFYQDYTANELTPTRDAMREGFLQPAQEAAMNGGLMPAISEAFSQRPNSGEYDAIARQEQNLKNQALNTGARGGLLKKQMFEASKNAATNKLNVMENARQNALQRAFQIFQPTAPTQGTALSYENLINQGNALEAQLGTQRNLAKLGGATADQAGSGAGLGSALGGLSSILGGLFSQGGGSSTPSFSLPSPGQGFSSVPFLQGYGS